MDNQELEELRAQRILIQQHLGWIEQKIADLERATEPTQSAEPPASDNELAEQKPPAHTRHSHTASQGNPSDALGLLQKRQ